MTSAPSRLAARLSWIDWMRGLACVLMFQTHCYDAWLGGDARNTLFLKNSQRLGTLPAPLFLFLAGTSFALVAGKLIRKNLSPAEITLTMVRRGAEIFAFGLLFRLQEYLIAWGWAPWSDLFRVDVLNIIGLSMIFMALLCGIVLGANKKMSGTPVPALVGASVAVMAVIGLLTPPLYTAWRPTWLPWQLESYIDGCHNLGAPQPWLFPLFPWAGFAFAGLAAGFVLFSDWGRERTAEILAVFSAMGAVAILVAYLFDHSSVQLYSVYDYWHTSPNFYMMRVGMLLMIAFLAYAWCRWALPSLGSWAIRFSPLIQLGQASLLVYWVHIEFVYGRFSLLPKRSVGIATATRGLLEISIFMLILSVLRTRIDWKGIGAALRSRVRAASVALLALLLLAFSIACRAPQHRYSMTGEIITIDRASHELIVHNDDIPNYMKAMTMPFQVKDPAVLDRLQPGQRIKATLIASDTQAWIEDIQVISQDQSKPALSSSQFKTPTEGEPVPDFVFTNQDGRRVHLAQYKGKVLILTFIYTLCPMPDFCPRMTNNFLAIEKSLKTDPSAYSRTHLLSITFDPEFDTPKVLREHALSVTSIPASELFPHWEFLTPRPQDLDSIARFFALSRWKENDQITHSLSTAIIDRDGKLYRWYHGNSWTSEELVREAKTAAGGI